MESLKHKPSGFWLGDDSSPLQDYSGYSLSATLTGTEKKGLPLSCDATYSQVLDRSTTATFASPVYVAGKEKQPFSLAATISPAPKTEGYESQAYRENMIPNPSVESSIGNWSQTSGATVVRGTTRAVTGTASIDVTTTGLSGQGVYWPSPTLSVISGETYTFSGYVFMASAVPSISATMRFQDSLIQSVGPDITTNFSNPTVGAWVRVSVTGTAPEGADRVVPMIRIYAAHTAQTFQADGLLLERSSTLGSYFDGSIIGHEWTGTAHNSISRTMTRISRINLAGPISNGNNSTESNGIYPLDAVNTTINRSFSWNGSTWLKFTWNGTGNRILRQAGPYSGFKQGALYSVTATFGNDGAAPVTINVDMADTNSTGITIQPGQTGKITVVGTRNQWTTVHRFADFEIQSTNSILIKDVIIQETTDTRDFFSASSNAGTEWAGVTNASPSYMLASYAEQQILSNQNLYDGLTLDGTVVSFSTTYTNTGEAKCSYDLGSIRRADIVGVHSESKNSLYVDGTIVAEVDISDEQQADTYNAPNNNLYSGLTESSQGVMVNNIGIYAKALNTEQVYAIHTANSRSTETPFKVYNGEEILVSSTARRPYLEEAWEFDEDWEGGTYRNVSIEDDYVHSNMTNDLTTGGYWIGTVDLYNGAVADTINAVSIEWQSKNATVQTSQDGVTWVAATSGTLVTGMSNGFNPTDKALHIKVTFDAGVDEAYISQLKVRGYLTNTTTFGGRTITYTNPAVPYEDEFFTSNWGVRLLEGTLSIGADTVSSAPTDSRTVEVWVKPFGDYTLSSNLSGATNKYVNGVSGTTTRYGEWQVLHFTSASSIAGPYTISGNVQVGKVVIYPTLLSATDINKIIAGYFGVIRSIGDDSSPIAILEPTLPALIYDTDWQIYKGG